MLVDPAPPLPVVAVVAPEPPLPPLPVDVVPVSLPHAVRAAGIVLRIAAQPNQLIAFI